MLAQGDVNAAEARADRRGDGALDGNLGLGDRIEHVLGQWRAKLVHDAGAGLWTFQLIWTPVASTTRRMAG